MPRREIHLVGSVPLRPAETVFSTIAGTLSSELNRIPDGEQSGWVDGVRSVIAAHPAFASDQQARL